MCVLVQGAVPKYNSAQCIVLYFMFNSINCYFFVYQLFLLLMSMFYDSSKCQSLCIYTISRLYIVACTVQRNNS